MAKRRSAVKRKEALDIGGATDIGTPETRAHGCAEVFDSISDAGVPIKRARVRAQIRLDYLLVIGRLSRGEWEAGERLRRDYHIAGLLPRVTVNLAAVGGGGRTDVSDMAIAAQKRAFDAVGALSPIQCEVALWLLFWDMGPLYIGRMLGAVGKTAAIERGMQAVHDALRTLADHYGIDCDE